MIETGMGPRLFHPAVWMPKLPLPDREIPLQYGAHAREAAEDDRFGNLLPFLPLKINPNQCQVVEVEVTGKVITKLVLRTGMTDDLDLVLVVRTRQTEWFVATVWANEKRDDHGTLNPRRYATAL